MRRGFSDVAEDVADLEGRLAMIEPLLLGISYIFISLQRDRSPELSLVETTTNRVVPALNFPLEMIQDVYVNAPVLLEPFSMQCAVSARILTD